MHFYGISWNYEVISVTCALSAGLFRGHGILLSECRGNRYI